MDFTYHHISGALTNIFRQINVIMGVLQYSHCMSGDHRIYSLSLTNLSKTATKRAVFSAGSFDEELYKRRLTFLLIIIKMIIFAEYNIYAIITALNSFVHK